MNNLFKVLLLPIIIMAVQILLLNHIHMVDMAVPFIYIFILMKMPYQTPPYVLMVFGFLLGLIIDLFMNTMGLNASAATFLAFTRPFIIDIISKKDYSESNPAPNVYINGFVWSIQYCLLCAFFHETFLYTIEAFSFNNYGQTLVRILSGTVLSAILILITEYLTQKQK